MIVVLIINQFWDVVELPCQNLNVSEPAVFEPPHKTQMLWKWPWRGLLCWRAKTATQTYILPVNLCCYRNKSWLLQPGGLCLVCELEQVLVLATMNEDNSSELQAVVEFYRDDFNKLQHECHIELFSQMEIEHDRNAGTFKDIFENLKALSSSQLPLISQVLNK